MIRNSPLTSRGLRLILVAAGLVCTALGIVGIFLPLLPTVPLLLLAAALFARSSERFYIWLLEHKQLGPLIRDHMNGGGIPLRAKITAIGLVWITIPLTAILFLQALWARILLIAVGLSISVYLLRLPTLEGGQVRRE